MSARIFTGHVIAKPGKGGLEVVPGTLEALKDEAWKRAEERLGMERAALERDHGYGLTSVEVWSLP